MEVLPPPDYPPLSPSEYPQPPTTTPAKILEDLHASFVGGDIKKFREILDTQNSSSDEFDIRDLHKIFTEAIKLDAPQFIQELLDRGFPMNILFALDAVKVKGKNALDTFIKNGWDINEPLNPFNPPVLGYAVENEMVAWLLDHGADPNQQSMIDITPLSLAVENGPIPVIQLLLNRGGDTRKGQLLHHAIDRKSDETTVLKLLIENGADINSILYENHEASRAMYCFMRFGTALHKAVELSKVEAVRYLISEGASLDIKDKNGLTALEFAQTLKQQEIIQALEEGN